MPITPTNEDHADTLDPSPSDVLRDKPAYYWPQNRTNERYNTVDSQRKATLSRREQIGNCSARVD